MSGPLVRLGARTPDDVRLVCFPYAGGGAHVFQPLAERVVRPLGLWSVTYPGRGSRLREPPLDALSVLVQSLHSAVQELLDRPVVFLGHSMGALVAYELILSLPPERRRNVRGLIVSAASAPQHRDDRRPTANMSDEAFLEELQRLGGTPPAFFGHPELVELFLPALRADFRACETYRPAPASPIAAPIRAVSGADDDDIGEDAVNAWTLLTRGGFEHRRLTGGHFLLHDEKGPWAETVLAFARTLLADG